MKLFYIILTAVSLVKLSEGTEVFNLRVSCYDVVISVCLQDIYVTNATRLMT